MSDFFQDALAGLAAIVGDKHSQIEAIAATVPHDSVVPLERRAATAALVAQINEIVDDETAAQGGAISAEHGIGIANRSRLARVADPLDIAPMRDIKKLLDPKGLMSPGKICSAGGALG
jgi:hypothetical protein